MKLQKPTALRKNYVLHSYFGTIVLKVLVIAYTVYKQLTHEPFGGNKRSYT